ncbi:hypothetical protein QUC26_17325 [Pseudomonas asiatica]|uniref:phage pre-tape measure protein n=1 Tax=Pseudomonas TaxID=286 RepID=UPI0025A14E14|nr:hypothetical protein [Pseudomonas asiatica]MDM9589519.1 hypothetical protein [Pseudomonas asiatica]WJM51633.1 hypothetical protein QUC26_17325 [Pseudomonas asiatica]
MSLLDLVVPYRKVIINQAIDDKPEVSLDVFGLTTEDFISLADEHAKILAAIFFHNAKKNGKASDNSKVIMLQFPAFGASCIALGCKQPGSTEHVRNLPLMTQVELLSTVLSLTFPEGLKKSLEKLAPTIALLLKK